MVIKVFGQAAPQAAGFRKATDALREVEMRALHAQTLWYPGVEFLAFVSSFLGVGIAAYLILRAASAGAGWRPTALTAPGCWTRSSNSPR